MYRIFIFAILFFALQTSAQETAPLFKIGGTGGFGFYGFNDLKEANDNVISTLPFETRVIDDFPARGFFGGYALLRITDWFWTGPSYEFHSTGSRIGAKDYSGSYHFDQILSTHQLGIQNEVRISSGTAPAISVELTGGLNFSQWNMDELLKVGEETQKDNQDWQAMKPFVMPAFKVSYPLVSGFVAFARAGYLFDLGGKFHLAASKDYESAQKVPWSGFRISAGLEFMVSHSR